MTAPLDPVDVIDAHYDQALKAIGEARVDRDRSRSAAREASRPALAGVERAEAEGYARVLQHRLGAADALEQLADALGVQLTNDRRARV